MRNPIDIYMRASFSAAASRSPLCFLKDFFLCWSNLLLHDMDAGENDLESTVFKNYRKSLIQHYQRSELRYILSGQKLIKNGPFWPEAYGQKVLPGHF